MGLVWLRRARKARRIVVDAASQSPIRTTTPLVHDKDSTVTPPLVKGTKASPRASGKGTTPLVHDKDSTFSPRVSDQATTTPRVTRNGTNASPPVNDQATASPRATRNGTNACLLYTSDAADE